MSKLRHVTYLYVRITCRDTWCVSKCVKWHNWIMRYIMRHSCFKIVSCGIFVWQHHCRNCGEIFCNECSSTKMPLPSSAKPVRVCDDCSTKLLQRYSANWWNRQSPTNLTCFLWDTSDSSILSQKNCLETEPSWCVQFTINLAFEIVVIMFCYWYSFVAFVLKPREQLLVMAWLGLTKGPGRY